MSIWTSDAVIRVLFSLGWKSLCRLNTLFRHKCESARVYRAACTRSCFASNPVASRISRARNPLCDGAIPPPRAGDFVDWSCRVTFDRWLTKVSWWWVYILINIRRFERKCFVKFVLLFLSFSKHKLVICIVIEESSLVSREKLSESESEFPVQRKVVPLILKYSSISLISILISIVRSSHRVTKQMTFTFFANTTLRVRQMVETPKTT